jgi:replicative DNA helicase
MGTSTGFFDLDQKLMGLQGGELTVIAARPSMGKTALMTRMALHAASQGKRVVIFSLEMDAQILTTRLLAAHAQVSLSQLRKNLLDEEGREKVRTALAELKEMEIWVEDCPTCSIERVEQTIDQDLKADIVFVDYLQLMTVNDNYSNRYQEVDAVCRGLKAIAWSHDIPVVVMCQLNRDIEKRTSKEPRVSDLRESGGIEQIADVILLLHRPAYYALYEENEQNVDDGESFLIIGKNRNGPRGRIEAVWLGDWCTFLPAPPSFSEFGG